MKSKYFIGQQFQNDQVLVQITNLDKHKVELGGRGWKSKKWLYVNNFSPVYLTSDGFVYIDVTFFYKKTNKC